MKQEEIFEVVVDERKKQGFSREELDFQSGTTIFGTILEITNGGKKRGTVMLSTLIKLLDGLGLELVIEDKQANWGLDMRLRRMPRKLYTGQRIEARELIRKEGLSERVDLFDSPEAVLKFITKPCDVYEVLPNNLLRKNMDMFEHEYATMYSYNGDVSPDAIENRVTYR